jgi:hypothetical protein
VISYHLTRATVATKRLVNLVMLRDLRQQAKALNAERERQRELDKNGAAERAVRDFREKFDDCIARVESTGKLLARVCVWGTTVDSCPPQE